MKTPSRSLFELVHALSGGELAYFSRYFQGNARKRREEGSVRAIFNAVRQQSVHSETAVRRLVSGINQFSVLKHYLYRRILDAMAAYHAMRPVNKLLRTRVNQIEFLCEKSLYVQAYHLLLQTKKAAHRHEKFPLLLDLFQMERNILLQAASDIPLKEVKIKFLDREMSVVLGKMSNLAAFQSLIQNVASLERRSGDIRDARISAELRRITGTPLMRHQGMAMSRSAKVAYHTVRSVYLHLRIPPDLAGSYSHARRALDVARGNMMENPSGYLAMASNVFMLAGKLKRWGDVLTLLRDMENNFSSANKRLSGQTAYYFLERIHLGELNYYVFSGNFEEGVKERAGETERFLLSHGSFMPGSVRITFYYLLAYLYFGVGQFSRSRDYINRLLLETAHSQRQDLHGIARVLNLILHYELGDWEGLEYHIRAAYRFLTRKKILFLTEDSIIRFIRSNMLLQVPGSTNAMREAFFRLHHELTTVMKAPAEQKFTGYFDILSWLEAKMTGRPFSAIVRKKAGQ